MKTQTSIAFTAAAAGIGVQAFGLFLPPVVDIRLGGAVEDREGRADAIRSGEIFAATAVIVLCGFLAYHDKTPLPLFVGAGTAAAMIAAYEWSLKGAP